MAQDTVNRKYQKRPWVNIYNEWEYLFWLKEFECTRKQLEKALTEVGTSAERVNDYFKSKTHKFS